MQSHYASENYYVSKNLSASIFVNSTSSQRLKFVLFCGIMLLAIALYKDRPKFFHTAVASPNLPCKGNPQAQSLSPQQLKILEKTTSGTPKSALKSGLPDAYCQLPSVVVRAGAVASRDVFRINSNGSTEWGIAMYEGDRFAGFRVIND